MWEMVRAAALTFDHQWSGAGLADGKGDNVDTAMDL